MFQGASVSDVTPLSSWHLTPDQVRGGGAYCSPGASVCLFLFRRHETRRRCQEERSTSKVLSAQLEQLYLHSLIALVFILGGWTWPSLCSLAVMFLQLKGELTSPWKWTNLPLWLYQVWGGLCIAFNFCLRNSLQCVLCSCSLLLTLGCCAWKRNCFKALKTGFSFIWGGFDQAGWIPKKFT